MLVRGDTPKAKASRPQAGTPRGAARCFFRKGAIDCGLIVVAGCGRARLLFEKRLVAPAGTVAAGRPETKTELEVSLLRETRSIFLAACCRTWLLVLALDRVAVGDACLVEAAALVCGVPCFADRIVAPHDADVAVSSLAVIGRHGVPPSFRAGDACPCAAELSLILVGAAELSVLVGAGLDGASGRGSAAALGTRTDCLRYETSCGLVVVRPVCSPA